MLLFSLRSREFSHWIWCKPGSCECKIFVFWEIVFVLEDETFLASKYLETSLVSYELLIGVLLNPFSAELHGRSPDFPRTLFPIIVSTLGRSPPCCNAINLFLFQVIILGFNIFHWQIRWKSGQEKWSSTWSDNVLSHDFTGREQSGILRLRRVQWKQKAWDDELAA